MLKCLIVADVHGNWSLLEDYQRDLNPDLCLIVGDVETVRSEEDLEELTGPEKYIEVGDFPDFYNGKKTLPVETWFIGGNHEIWSYLHEHNPNRDNDPRLIENLYYLGRAGLQTLQGITIAYLTGIYSSKHYEDSSEERLKWCEGMDWHKSRATGYYRKDEVESVIDSASGEEIDILLTHDWPATTAFDMDSLDDELLPYGNNVLAELNRLIEPRIHLAGHIHRGIKTSIDGNRFFGLGRLGSDYGKDALIINENFETRWFEEKESQ